MDDFATGTMRFMTGVGKKVLLANNIGLDENADVRWTCVFMHQPGEWLTDAWLKFEKEELINKILEDYSKKF